MLFEIILRMVLIAGVSYCCGSLNGAIIVSKAEYKSDVRERGSKNAGLTNFYRVYGAAKLIFVVLIDIGKAWMAVLVGGILLEGFGLSATGKLLALLFVIVGHMFPIPFEFRGGKGVLATLGALFVIDQRLALIALSLMAAVVLLTRYISLASILMAALFPLGIWFSTGSVGATLLSLLCAGLIIYMHRGNISRLLHGTESKFRFPGEKDRRGGE